jgi:diguanylate cyclase (GGDEF)-like protein
MRVLAGSARGVSVGAIRSERLACLVPFGACFVVTWGLIGVQTRLHVGEVAAACALQLLVGGLLVLPGGQSRTWAVRTGMLAFIASVALLRDGVGPTPGYGPLLLLPVIWAALRNRRSELVLAILGIPSVLYLPIILIGGTHYPPSGWRGGALLIVVAAVLGVAVLTLVGTIGRQRDAATAMLSTQLALREIATLIATGDSSASVLSTAADQLGHQFEGVAASMVVRFDGPSGFGEIVGGWSSDGGDITGQRIDLSGPTSVARLYQASAPVAVTDAGVGQRSEQILGRPRPDDAVVAPVTLGDMLWGAVGVVFAAGTATADGVEDRISRFAELIAVAIANAQAWETVSRQASTDPLTGLANHRTFRDRLSSEVERASRYQRALSLILFDLDHFKHINDTHGHQTGDATLITVAERIAALARDGDLVARIGGEEFAWLLPETTQDSAYLAAERARRAIAATSFQAVGKVTVSAGVCSNLHASTAQELLRAADRALDQAKDNGRDITSMYTETTSTAPAGVTLDPR